MQSTNSVLFPDLGVAELRLVYFIWITFLFTTNDFFNVYLLLNGASA